MSAIHKADSKLWTVHCAYWQPCHSKSLLKQYYHHCQARMERKSFLDRLTIPFFYVACILATHQDHWSFVWVAGIKSINFSNSIVIITLLKDKCVQLDEVYREIPPHHIPSRVKLAKGFSLDTSWLFHLLPVLNISRLYAYTSYYEGGDNNYWKIE